jgi:hypothetical protein
LGEIRIPQTHQLSDSPFTDSVFALTSMKHGLTGRLRHFTLSSTSHAEIDTGLKRKGNAAGSERELDDNNKNGREGFSPVMWLRKGRKAFPTLHTADQGDDQGPLEELRDSTSRLRHVAQARELPARYVMSIEQVPNWDGEHKVLL